MGAGVGPLGFTRGGLTSACAGCKQGSSKLAADLRFDERRLLPVRWISSMSLSARTERRDRLLALQRQDLTLDIDRVFETLAVVFEA